MADALIEELFEADVVLLGVSTYNFSLPSPIKAWFDHIARAQMAFRYSADGPIGLLRDKKAYVVLASGGRYAGTGNDFRTSYIHFFLSFLGIANVKFIYAEGMALGEEERRTELEEANRRIDELVAEAFGTEARASVARINPMAPLEHSSG